jgi:hypothetical protein
LPVNGAIFNPYEPTNKFMPARGHLEHLIEAAYLRPRSARLLTPEDVFGPPGRLGWRWRLSMCGAALRGSRANVGQLAAKAHGGRERMQRAFLVCDTIAEENPAHAYCPPFGLHAYDPRFAGDRELPSDPRVHETTSSRASLN